jgi:enoyl-CoA hydratase
MSDAAQELVQERRGPILTIRLNRPDARNALNGALIAGIGAAVVEAESDPEIRTVVITGTGDRSFCAGMDLQAFASGDGAGISAGAMDDYNRLLRGEIAVPVIGAANASAVGGGLELLLGCDLIVASNEARFGFPEVRRGFFPAGGGTNIGTRVPLGIAFEMTLTGELIDAARAYEIGLLNAMVPPEEVMPTALAFAERIAECAPLGLAASKELVRLGVTDAVQAAARLEHWQTVVFQSEDAQEGARAFVEKRKPVWRGV